MNTDHLLALEKEKFKDGFLQDVNLPDFARQEEEWIKNNLDFIYSAKQPDVPMAMNPYGKFVAFDTVEEGKPCKETYLLLPKFLCMSKLVIHAALVDKADKIITVMADYKSEFTFAELSNSMLGHCEIDRRLMLEKNLHTLIRKFLSYQYLVIH